MPLHEYQCKKCKRRFERILKFSDPDPKKCPQCGGPLERLLHAPAVQFKGSGWYVTDYGRQKGGESSGAKESSEPAGSGSPAAKEKSESKSQSKPEKKSSEREK